jgi:hypothetical protein
MKRKGEGMTGLIGGMAVAGLGLASVLVSAGCQEKGRPDPGVQMVASHEREASPSGGGEGGAGMGSAAGTETGANPPGAPKVPTRLVVPPEVAKTYSAIRLTWKDSAGGKEGTVDIPLGGSARVPNSELEVHADVFLPAFTMTADEITSNGVELTNPAARLTVVEKDKQVFGGWIFTNFPGIHPFEHPRFSLRLAGGVKKPA